MLLTKLKVVSTGNQSAAYIFWMMSPAIVSDDSWFGKCAGVHKPLIPTHKPFAKPFAELLSYLLGAKNFSDLWDDICLM